MKETWIVECRTGQGGWSEYRRYQDDQINREHLTAEGIAAELQANPSPLERLFVPPIEYRIVQRIEEVAITFRTR